MEGIDYLAQHGVPTRAEDLASHRAITLSRDPVRYWPILEQNVSCRRVLTCNNITFAREAALAGAGIAALPTVITDRRCVRVIWSSFFQRSICRLARCMRSIPRDVFRR